MIISPALPTLLLLPEVVATLSVSASPVLTKPVAPVTQASAPAGGSSYATTPAASLARLFGQTPPPGPVASPAPFTEGEVLMSVHGVEFSCRNSTIIAQHNSIPGVGPALLAKDGMQERDGFLYQIQVTDQGGIQKSSYDILPVGRWQDGRAIKDPSLTPSRVLRNKTPVRLFYNFIDSQGRPLAGSSFAVTDETRLYGLDGKTRLTPPHGTSVEKVVTTYENRGSERVHSTTTLFWFFVDKDGKLVQPPPFRRPRPATFATLTSHGRALYVETFMNIYGETRWIRLYLSQAGRLLQWKDLRDVSRHPAFSDRQEFLYFHPVDKRWIVIGRYDAASKRVVFETPFDELIKAEVSF